MNLTVLVENWEATDKICHLTGKPIFANEPMYVLNDNHYHESIDIDKLISEVTNGQYNSAKELYDDDSDYYYWTENYSVEDVVALIEEEGEYYDEKGKLVKL